MTEGKTRPGNIVLCIQYEYCLCVCHQQIFKTSRIRSLKPQINSSDKLIHIRMQPVLNSVYKALYFNIAAWNCYEAIANSKTVHSLIEAWGGWRN